MASAKLSGSLLARKAASAPASQHPPAPADLSVGGSPATHLNSGEPAFCPSGSADAPTVPSADAREGLGSASADAASDGPPGGPIGRFGLSVCAIAATLAVGVVLFTRTVGEAGPTIALQSPGASPSEPGTVPVPTTLASSPHTAGGEAGAAPTTTVRPAPPELPVPPSAAVASPTVPVAEPMPAIRAAEPATEPQMRPAGAAVPAGAAGPTVALLRVEPPAQPATASRPAIPVAEPPPAAGTVVVPQSESAAAGSAPAPVRPPAAVRLPAETVGALLARGDALFGSGDIASARLFYEHAAEGGDAQAALRLGETFDPVFLARTRLNGVRGDAATAARWYRRAGELGAAEAEVLLIGIAADSEIPKRPKQK